MRPIATDVARSVVCVCVLCTRMSDAKTADRSMYTVWRVDDSCGSKELLNIS